MTQYYDIGLNLFCKQFRDPEQIIRNAESAGVTCILTGSDMDENRKASRFSDTHAVYATCGIHPHNADSARKGDFDEIEQILTTHPRVKAVGECGLDFDRMFSTKENQIRCLEKHIVLAEKLGMPMFLHERSASAEFAKRFRGHEDVCKRSVVHCFTGTRAELETYLEMGFSIGITGWICDDRRAQDLRDAVKILPLDRVLLETDAPYLTPRNVKGLDRTNVPENIRYVAETLAGYMNVSLDALQTAARANTERVFRIGGENA
ncbi:MAG: TatD family hydrolase [Oscillospiraceae bacterium]|nr:TatD family hydrolase [Oscillospiraceae bacterium]